MFVGGLGYYSWAKWLPRYKRRWIYTASEMDVYILCPMLYACMWNFFPYCCVVYYLQSAGDLQNDEHTANIMLQIVKSSNKLLATLAGEGKGAFHRVSG